MSTIQYFVLLHKLAQLSAMLTNYK